MIAGQSSCMRAGIVLPQCTRPVPLQKWKSLGVQYFINITQHTEIPQNNNQAGFPLPHSPTPHHNASLSISVPLTYTDIGMPFPISTLNWFPSISMAKVKGRFICEEDIIPFLPMPIKMLPGSSHASGMMTYRQYQAHVGATYPIRRLTSLKQFLTVCAEIQSRQVVSVAGIMQHWRCVVPDDYLDVVF